MVRRIGLVDRCHFLLDLRTANVVVFTILPSVLARADGVIH